MTILLLFLYGPEIRGQKTLHCVVHVYYCTIRRLLTKTVNTYIYIYIYTTDKINQSNTHMHTGHYQK